MRPILAFGAAAVVFLAILVIRIVRARLFYSHAIPARATLVRYVTELSWNGPDTYRPIVEFHTRDGAQVEAASPSSDNIGHGRIGREVRIWYDPADPKKIRLKGLRGSGTIINVLLLVLAAVAAGICWIGLT